jgi:hypothetical protein
MPFVVPFDDTDGVDPGQPNACDDECASENWPLLNEYWLNEPDPPGNAPAMNRLLFQNAAVP